MEILGGRNVTRCAKRNRPKYARRQNAEGSASALGAGSSGALALGPVSRTPPGLRLDGAAFERDIPGPRGHGDRCVAIDADTHLRGGPIVDQLHLAATQRADGNDLAKLRQTVRQSDGSACNTTTTYGPARFVGRFAVSTAIDLRGKVAFWQVVQAR